MANCGSASNDDGTRQPDILQRPFAQTKQTRIIKAGSAVKINLSVSISVSQGEEPAKTELLKHAEE